MTPLEFEARYQADWDELEQLLKNLRMRFGRRRAPAPGDRFASLYRRACEQLAMARARAYPAHIIDRLNQLTSDAHQVIYRERGFGFSRLLKVINEDFPNAGRAQAKYFWLATAVFALPFLVLNLLVYFKPAMILAVVDAATAANFEYMYSESESIGRTRDAGSDWTMFGYYIRHNIGIGFQCFAGGIFAGLGSIFFLAYNGALLGAVEGFLLSRGLAEPYFSFVATHSAFELTAIALSGAGGLRIGHAIIAPGRRTRRNALVAAAREAILLVYGATFLFFVAAIIEAFWSSARWIPLPLKFTVAAACWAFVIGYLWRHGRPQRRGQKATLADDEAPHAG
jgi:uncharacterized membrane protein SpoIIM required for sporulation